MASKPAHLQVLIDMLDDALLCATEDGKVVDCNDAACRMFGYTRQELTSLTRDLCLGVHGRRNYAPRRAESRGPLFQKPFSGTGLLEAVERVLR